MLHISSFSEIHALQSACRLEGTKKWFYLKILKLPDDTRKSWYDDYKIQLGDTVRGCCLRQQKVDSDYFNFFYNGWKCININEVEIEKVEVIIGGDLNNTIYNPSIEFLVQNYVRFPITVNQITCPEQTQ